VGSFATVQSHLLFFSAHHGVCNVFALETPMERKLPVSSNESNDRVEWAIVPCTEQGLACKTIPSGGSTRKKQKLLHKNPCAEARRFFNEITPTCHCMDSFEKNGDSREYL